jgi:site-specific DNA-methyltransferase (adenine-specific)
MILHADSSQLPLPDCSVDAVITDPPYGLSFMGKQWDKAVPPVALWREVLRVLKPGAFAAILCTPRQDCQARMILNLEAAGFVTGFTSVLWTYATGFPKAANLSKLADKRAGAEREVVGLSGRLIAPNPKATNYQGTQTFAETAEGREKSQYLTAPATPEAKALDGAYAGFQPKPAFEPVLVVMKPLAEKTYLDQALDNGKGCSWLDDGRIPTGESLLFGSREIGNGEICGTCNPDDGGHQHVAGRFPANVLCSDNVMDDGRERAVSGCAKSGNASGAQSETCFGQRIQGTLHNDSGSYSRYFDLDAWWAERVASLPESVRKVYPWLIVPKPSKREKNAGLDRAPVTVGDGRQKSIDNPFQRGETERVNSHVSVKPVRLMSYLIALFSRPGETILDPFAGSGTTAVASAIMGRECMAVELDPEYAEIAHSRALYAEKHDAGTMAFELAEQPTAPAVDPRQVDLFGGDDDA